MRLLSEDITIPATQPYLLPVKALVVVPPINTALTGDALKVSQDLNFQAKVTNNNAKRYNLFLKEATEAIEQWCRRIFAKQGYSTRIYIDHDDTCKEIRLLQTPIDRTSIIMIDSSGAILSDHDFVVGEDTLIPINGWANGILTIEYRGGFEKIPKLVERAAVQAMNYLHLDYERSQGRAVDEDFPRQWELGPPVGKNQFGNSRSEANEAYRERAAWEREHPRSRLLDHMSLSYLDPYVRMRI